MASVFHGLTLESWRSFAFPRMTPSGSALREGIMVATAPNGVFRGACCYAFESRYSSEASAISRCFAARNLVLPLVGRNIASHTLARSLRWEALAHRSTVARIELPAYASPEAATFQSAGFVVTIVTATHELC